MKNEILDIAKKLYHNHLTPETATNLLLDLFSVSNNTCVQIFNQPSEVDDYEFNLHQHWKDDDNRNGYDSKPIGRFSDY